MKFRADDCKTGYFGSHIRGKCDCIITIVTLNCINCLADIDYP